MTAHYGCAISWTIEARRRLIGWRDVSLLGIDVGYSQTRATTGIAAYRFGQPLRLQCVRFDAAERRAALQDGGHHDAIAIDGPLLPNPDLSGLRASERILSRGAFARRCKAGFSHFGEGLKLRHAAAMIASELKPCSSAGAQVVEAFPNAFLGVMLEDAAYASFPPSIPRGRKSDLFYARAAEDGCFARLFDHLGWHDDAFKSSVHGWAQPTTRLAHEYRAAIVCVLTAACALAGQTEAIGDVQGGHIHLPPRDLWAPWALDALNAIIPPSAAT